MGENIRNTFRKALINQMKEKDVNQVELSHAIGVSKTTVNNWVLGYNVPRMDKIDKLCSYFGVSRDYLIGSPDSHNEESYYTDSETIAIAEKLKNNKDLRLLFDAAEDASAEDLKFTHDMLLRLKKNEQGRDD